MTNPKRPAAISHWSEIEEKDEAHYRGDDEKLAIGAPFGRHFGLTRIGIHHERLLPGRRTSYPHAESAEEEFVYVIEGLVDAWIDGPCWCRWITPGRHADQRCRPGRRHRRGWRRVLR